MKEQILTNLPYLLAVAAFVVLTTWKKLESRRAFIEKAIDAAFYVVENIKAETETKVDDKAAEGLFHLKTMLAAKKIKVSSKIHAQAETRFKELHGRHKAAE
mgnify:CR=1 FL=1